MLADSLDIRCKLQKGLSFTGDEEGAHALLTLGLQEYVLDLVEVPGRMLPTKEGQPTLWPKTVSAAGETTRGLNSTVIECRGLPSLHVDEGLTPASPGQD